MNNYTKMFTNFVLNINKIKKLIFNGYYFNEIYNYYLWKNKNMSNYLYKTIDKGIIESLSHMTLVNFVKKILKFFSKQYKTKIDFIIYTMIVGLLLIIIIFYYFQSISLKLILLIFLFSIL